MRPASLIPLTLLLTLTACHQQPADNSGLTHVFLQTDWYPQPEHGGFYDAQVKGFYKAEGLDVTLIPGGPFANSAAQLANGKIQFAMDSSDHVLEAIANADQPIIAIGATMQHDPQGVMVHAESPIHTFADLEGHAVSVRPGAVWWQFIVHQFHLTRVREVPLTYSIANFVRDPGYIQQCFLTSEPYFANGAGTPARVLLISDAGYNPYRVFITSTGYMAAHPDVVAKFTRASVRGWRDYMQDPTAANAVIQKLNPAMNRDWARFSYEQLKKGNFITGEDPTGAQTGQFDPARWQTMYQQLLDLHVLNHPIDLSKAYTTQFLK
jgi:NitT/TauT family transport system substrate-binding protein